MDLLRRFWLGVEDPRAIALFRIVFGVLALCNVNGLVELFRFLFTDEGIFPAALARRVFAGDEFAGFGDGQLAGEPWGFFDERALGHFLGGPRLSLLYFWDSPTAMWIHVAAFELCMLAFIVGWRTRVAGVLGFLLMCSLFDRNPIFWEPTELLFRVFFVYLLCAKSGHAWSLDEWLRRRRLRRDGVAATYRVIPAWPRKLMMLQVALVYVSAGLGQHGEQWVSGDAVYYAISLEHFQRFEPQSLCAALGTNVLRVVTHLVHLFALGFPLVLVGEVLRVADQRRPVTVRGWMRRWILGRRIWIGGSTVLMLAIYSVMHIGLLQPAMLALGLVYFRGEEVARVLGRARPLAPTDVALPYRPFGRLCLVVVLAVHVVALTIWSVPSYDAIAEFRSRARALVRPWMTLTRTDQGWGFFAPNPMRWNVFMEVRVIEADGTSWDMRSDVYAEERRPIPYVWYDRMRKIHRRIIGGEAGANEWTRKWYARWQCRQWALEHDGVVPRNVELVRLAYEIPTPEEMQELGGYDPAERLRDHGRETTVYVEHCANAVMGQPLPEVAARHGVVASTPFVPWVMPRRAAWENRLTP